MPQGVQVQILLPAPRQKNSAPFRFRGLRKSRENCISAESFFLSQIGPASLGSDLDSRGGSDLDCPGAPRQKKPTAFRFRRGGESSISVASFFLSNSEVSRGTSELLFHLHSDHSKGPYLIQCVR